MFGILYMTNSRLLQSFAEFQLSAGANSVNVDESCLYSHISTLYSLAGKIISLSMETNTNGSTASPLNYTTNDNTSTDIHW